MLIANGEAVLSHPLCRSPSYLVECSPIAKSLGRLSRSVEYRVEKQLCDVGGEDDDDDDDDVHHSSSGPKMCLGDELQNLSAIQYQVNSGSAAQCVCVCVTASPVCE
jgi:hypothetical protein